MRNAGAHVRISYGFTQELLTMNELNQYMVPLLLLIGSILLGLLAEFLLYKRLKAVVVKSKWKMDDIIVNAFRRITGPLFIAGGIYAFIRTAPAHAYSVPAVKVVYTVVVFMFAMLVARFFVGLVRMKAKGANRNPATSIVSNIIRIAIYTIGLLIVLQSFGVSITPVLTALGVGALAVALALQDTLSNLFAGIQVIALRQVRINDYVKLDSGEEGYVADITWRNTIIRALANNYIIIPNSKLANAVLTNYYRPEKEMSVLVELGVAFSSDLEKVERVTIEAGKEIMQQTTGAVPESDPFIRYHTLGDSAIKFSVILRAKEFTDQYLIKHEFIKLIIVKYREHNIEIPFPMRQLLTEKPLTS